MQSALYSVVQNSSGIPMTFGFLPPHGVTLTAGQLYSVFGDIREAVTRTGHRNTSRRMHAALISALEAGDLSIVSTPSPVLKDHTSGASRMLRLNSGSLSLVDPGWAQQTETSIPA